MKTSQEEEKRYVELQMLALDFARQGDTKELQKMIQHGLSVNLSSHKDDSLLMLATYNGNFETSKMLIDNCADQDQINQRGQTPLEGVCFKGNLDIVKLLVQNGGKITSNALVYASIFGNKDIFNYLKESSNSQLKNRIFGINIEFIASVTTRIKNLLT